MKSILITLGVLLLAIVALGYTFPIYTLGVLISNVDLLPAMFSTVINISLGLLIVIAIFLVSAHNDTEMESTVAYMKKLAGVLLLIILCLSILKPFMPKDKETAMVLIGAQVLYDSDTARDVATQGADLLKRSVNVFSIKLKDYEKSLESNTTKE